MVASSTPSGVKFASRKCEIWVIANTNTRSKNNSTLVTRLCACGPRSRSKDPLVGANKSPLFQGLRLRYAGLQRQRMEYAAHLALQRLIHDLVLLDPGLAPERLGDHGCRVMVAVAGQIANRHVGVRNGGLDHGFDIV